MLSGSMHLRRGEFVPPGLYFLGKDKPWVTRTLPAFVGSTMIASKVPTCSLTTRHAILPAQTLRTLVCLPPT